MISKQLMLLFLLSIISLSAQAKKVKTYQHVYPNGLTLYFTENKVKPEFYAAVVVNVGGKEGPLEFTGLAHYLEHLLFKGNNKIGSINSKIELLDHQQVVDAYELRRKYSDPKIRNWVSKHINRLSLRAAESGNAVEYTNLSSSIGNQVVNAYTKEDQTAYISQFPNNKLSQWAQLESERYNNPIFRTFQWELEIVYEEKNMRGVSVYTPLFRKSSEALYPGHNYSNTIGTMEHLKDPSIQAVYDFFNQYYIANNMAVVISGDLDYEVVKKAIGTHFAYLRPGVRPELSLPEAPPLKEKKIIDIDKSTKDLVAIAYQIPGLGHPDYYPLLVINMILNNGIAGLLDVNIVKKQILEGAETYTGNYGKEHAAFYIFGAKGKNQSYEFVEKTLLGQLEKLKKGDFSKALLDAVILDLQMSHDINMASNKGRVRFLSDHFAYKSGPNILNEYSAIIAQVTKKKIVEVANKYFSKKYVLARVHNKKTKIETIKKPEISALPSIDYPESEYSRLLKLQKSSPILPQIIKFGSDYNIVEIKDSSTLYYAKNPINDLANLTIRFKRGFLHMPNAQYWSGLFSKFSSKKKNSGELASIFYQLGVTPKFSVGKKVSDLSLEGPQANIEKALALALEVLFRPVISQKLMENNTQQIIENRKVSFNKLEGIKSAAQEFLLNREDSSYLHMAKNKKLQALTPKDYLAFSNSLQSIERDYIYTGNHSQDDIVKMLKKHLNHDGLMAKATSRQKQMGEAEKSKIYFYNFTAAPQANIFFFRALSSYRDDNFSEQMKAMVFNQYWGRAAGLTSQLMIEIREKRALAYSAYSQYVYNGGALEQGERSFYYGFIGTQMDKFDEAFTTYQQITNESFKHSDAVLENRINIVKERLNTYRVGPWGMASYGWNRNQFATPDDGQIIFKKIAALNNLKSKDIQATLKNILSRGSIEFLVIGNKDQINFEKYQDQYEIIELKSSDIFPVTER